MDQRIQDETNLIKKDLLAIVNSDGIPDINVFTELDTNSDGTVQVIVQRNFIANRNDSFEHSNIILKTRRSSIISYTKY